MGTSTFLPPVVKAKSLSCPNCGGPVEMRGFAHSLSVVCPGCHSILDATNPDVLRLQQAQEAQRIQPTIPLGTRGNVNGIVWEVIGFQVREVNSDDGRFSWSEYLLFNPYQGFRYLTEYEGHWTFVQVISALPEAARSRTRPAVRYLGRLYRHYDHGQAQTAFVLGEFPWQVTAGETVQFMDYIDPPSMLSSEETEEEVTWSLAEYMSGAQIWQAFKLPGVPYASSGVFAIQPSPFKGKLKAMWRNWLLLTLLLLFFTVIASVGGRQQILRESYTYTPSAPNPAALTNEFSLPSGARNLELSIDSERHTDWVYFMFGLVNQKTGQSKNFGRELSGGENHNRVLLPGVPPGTYYLRVEPEKPPGSTPLNYTLTLRRNVPAPGWFWLGAILLLIPPVLFSIRVARFETARWKDSDYYPATVTSGESD